MTSEHDKRNRQSITFPHSPITKTNTFLRMHKSRNFLPDIIVSCVALIIGLVGYVTHRPSPAERDVAAARVLLDQGKKAYKADDTFTALSSLHQAMELSKNGVNDTIFFEASVYNALLYEHAGKSKETYRLLKSLKYVEVENSFASIFYLRMMAWLVTQIDKDYTRAMKLIEQDIILSRKIFPDDDQLPYIDRANLCELFYRKGETEQAWQSVEALERDSMKIRKYRDLCLSQVYYVHAALLFDAGKPDAAYAYASRGQECARRYGSTDNQMQNLEMKCLIDSARKDLTSYLANRRVLDSLNHKMMSAEILAQTSLLREQAKIALLETDNKRKHIINWLLAGLLTLALGFFSFIIYFIRRKASSRQRMTALEQERLSVEIQCRRLENELLKFKQQNTEQRLNEAYKDNIDMSVVLSNMEFGNDQSLHALERNLRLQHPTFTKRLRKAYPKLTENDMRVLGFIRMGYTSKVIASALNITINSLTTTRYRLKKKLKLTAKDDLYTFIKDF